jgi:aryl carrier-like protein
VVSADVADAVGLASALREIEATGPPLAGVIHAAGAFEDRLLRHHRWELFARVLAPKVSGSWNLHRLLAGRPLEFFVLFSSGSSLIGAAGLGNYVAANAFEDALAHLRRRRGLPALVVNWGPWREVGMAAAVGERRERQWRVEGVEPMDPEVALDAFGALLGSAGPPQIGVVAVHWPRFLAQHRASPFVGFLAEMRRGSTAAASRVASWRTASDGLAPAEVRRRLERWVSEEVAHLLGWADLDQLDPDVGLFEQGLDSLLSLELRNRLQAGVGQALPPTLLFKYPKVRDLVEHLAGEVLGLKDPAVAVAGGGASEPADAFAALSEAEAEALIREQWQALEGEG